MYRPCPSTAMQKLVELQETLSSGYSSTAPRVQLVAFQRHALPPWRSKVLNAS
jgi:hypothetical protein